MYVVVIQYLYAFVLCLNRRMCSICWLGDGGWGGGGGGKPTCTIGCSPQTSQETQQQKTTYLYTFFSVPSPAPPRPVSLSLSLFHISTLDLPSLIWFLWFLNVQKNNSIYILL